MNGVRLMSDGVVEMLATAAPASAGAILRQAREAAGVHIGALAVTMKIPVKKLEALESDQLDQLHDAVFVRALASSVCRTLHIDPAPVLERLPDSKKPQFQTDERGLNTPFRAVGEARPLSLRPLLTNPAAIMVTLLLAGALAVYVFPELRAYENLEQSSPEPVVPDPARVPNISSANVEPQTPHHVAPVMPPTLEPTASAHDPVVQPKQMASTPAMNMPSSKPLASSVAQHSAQASNPSASAPALPKDGVLVLKARGTTWVKVSDAKSSVLLSKILVAGEQVGVSGALPFAVVIGRSDLTDVLVRGQPFVAQGVSKDYVARFEVK